MTTGSPPPASTCTSNWRRTRSLNSAPALSVKVMAAMLANSTPSVTSATTRVTRLVVLPEPAPASTNNVVSRSSAMRWRAARSSAAAAGAPSGIGRLSYGSLDLDLDLDLGFGLEIVEQPGQAGERSDG